MLYNYQQSWLLAKKVSEVRAKAKRHPTKGMWAAIRHRLETKGFGQRMIEKYARVGDHYTETWNTMMQQGMDPKRSSWNKVMETSNHVFARHHGRDPRMPRGAIVTRSSSIRNQITTFISKFRDHVCFKSELKKIPIKLRH